jgi:hypothetical protein
MDIEEKKLRAIVEAFLTTKFPGAGAGEEEIEEWKDAVLDAIKEEFKEINAQEEEKAAAGKECDKTKKE